MTKLGTQERGCEVKTWHWSHHPSCAEKSIKMRVCSRVHVLFREENPIPKWYVGLKLDGAKWCKYSFAQGRDVCARVCMMCVIIRCIESIAWRPDEGIGLMATTQEPRPADRHPEEIGQVIYAQSVITWDLCSTLSPRAFASQDLRCLNSALVACSVVSVLRWLLKVFTILHVMAYSDTFVTVVLVFRKLASSSSKYLHGYCVYTNNMFTNVDYKRREYWPTNVALYHKLYTEPKTYSKQRPGSSWGINW